MVGGWRAAASAAAAAAAATQTLGVRSAADFLRVCAFRCVGRRLRSVLPRLAHSVEPGAEWRPGRDFDILGRLGDGEGCMSVVFHIRLRPPHPPARLIPLFRFFPVSQCLLESLSLSLVF